MGNKVFLSLYGLNEWDNTLFDDMHLPDALDRQTVIDRILVDTIQLDCIYADPQACKVALRVYSASRIHTWERVCQALHKNYDPFINFTRDETRTTEYEPGVTTKTVGSSKAWNDPDMVERDQAEMSRTGKDTTTETFHSEGDSAMYTPTDVALKEFRMRAEADAINFIVQDVKKYFCNLCY